jgi:hypothetical protein
MLIAIDRTRFQSIIGCGGWTAAPSTAAGFRSFPAAAPTATPASMVTAKILRFALRRPFRILDWIGAMSRLSCLCPARP